MIQRDDIYKDNTVSDPITFHWPTLTPYPMYTRLQLQCVLVFINTLFRQSCFTESPSKHVIWLAALADPQQAFVITWCVSENIQLDGAVCGWCQWTTKCAGAIINMRSSVHRTGRKWWSIKGDTNIRHRKHNVTTVKCPFLVTVYLFVNPVPKFLMRFTARVFHYTEHNRHIHAFFIPRFHCKCMFFFFLNWLWQRNLLKLDMLYITGSNSHIYTGNHMRIVRLTNAKQTWWQ